MAAVFWLGFVLVAFALLLRDIWQDVSSHRYGPGDDYDDNEL